MQKTPPPCLRIPGVLAILACMGPGAAAAKPIPHPIGVTRPAGARAAATLGAPAGTSSPWTPLTHQPDFLLDGASSPILLTDGSVLIQDAGFPDWWRLTPDAFGSYVNGTWSQVASLPATYSPLYHSSAVLPDGRLIIEGGEYLLSLDQTQLIPTWTNQGAIYDPVANTWTMIAPPAGWQTIGDAQSVVLANGTYMQANCCTTQAALLDATTLTWTATGAGKFDINDEEGWTLLPNNKVLTVDAYVRKYDPAGTGSELYDPVTGTWSSAGSTGVQLWDSCGGARLASYEVGPAVLRPNGTVFATGANGCGAGHTAVYDSQKATWSPGPDFPDALSIADGPAALEPNGKVLVMTSPFFDFGAVYFEWNGQRLNQVPGPPNAPFEISYFGNMLVLPTGQILLTDFYNDIEIFTPSADDVENPPAIEGVPSSVIAGRTYRISGTGFNGVSQGAAYGDDAQGATNYPLVRITSKKTGHVFYARTHDHSSMAVASRERVYTYFDVSAGTEKGKARLEVVVNGVASAPVSITVE